MANQPVYVVKNNHDHEGGNFCFYDGEYNMIEQKYFTFDDIKAYMQENEHLSMASWADVFYGKKNLTH